MILVYLDTLAYHRSGSLFEGGLRKELGVTPYNEYGLPLVYSRD